jgi:nucleotide-binding universal stress UspA family protein
MSNTILLAVALQRWEQPSAYALVARDVAVALARGTSKHLHVLSVYAYERINTHGLPHDVAAKYRDEQIQRLDATIRRKMATYVAPLEAAGMQVSKLLRVGNPREVVVQVATEVEADLLIIGTRSKRGIRDIAFGGATQQISKRAPCPVLLVSWKNDLGSAPISRQWRTGDEV